MGRSAEAERPVSRYKWGVHGADSTLRLLERCDRAPLLPRLGGMARPNGVVIVSERFWAFASTDGSIREGRMPQPPASLRRVPLVRGLARLYASLSPLFHGRGIAAPRERLLLLVAVLAPLAFVFLPGRWSTVAGALVASSLLAALLRGRTLSLHGAEHRAIAAAEHRQLMAAWDGSSKPSRFSERCGTNFAAIAVPVTVAAERLWPLSPALYTPAVLLTLSLALSMELWFLVQRSSARLRRVVLAPGLALQRVTTREPRLDETRLALAAVGSVLRRELA